METQIIKIQIIAQLIVKHRQAIQTRKKHRLTMIQTNLTAKSRKQRLFQSQIFLKAIQ